MKWWLGVLEGFLLHSFNRGICLRSLFICLISRNPHTKKNLKLWPLYLQIVDLCPHLIQQKPQCFDLFFWAGILLFELTCLTCWPDNWSTHNRSPSPLSEIDNDLPLLQPINIISPLKADPVDSTDEVEGGPTRWVDAPRLPDDSLAGGALSWAVVVCLRCWSPAINAFSSAGAVSCSAEGPLPSLGSAYVVMPDHFAGVKSCSWALALFAGPCLHLQFSFPLSFSLVWNLSSWLFTFSLQWLGWASSWLTWDQSPERRTPHYGAANFWAGRLLIGLEFKIQPSDWSRGLVPHSGNKGK